ncbi:large conductance mechanosensitive channel [Winogradskyella wandonensis]|uniref:Large-conductance mechanosensitive channel n=1 Tax=Winogradskyella wandonensis TaxID=1442586 RepID=A0A4R1KJD1_9FLAO|nr:large conductance mechanosensitive channel protein MscL [Winogradskyella wandonensis]TCK64852.1 large conductance mechanosensitive channel [Winogradskyella wandonensis]
MKLLKEFKEFAVKGNMMDMAIGIIIGAAFNKVIDVLAKQVLLPPLSLLSEDVNLENQKFILREAATNVDEVAIAYGKLAEVFLDFLIIGFTVFVVIKAMNRLKRKAQDSNDTSVSTPKDIELLSQLTELMEEQNKILKTLNASK